MTEGWVIMNANMDQYRAWQNGGTVWVKDLADATFYARRVDAEAVHLDDDAAWRVVRKPLPDGGEAVHTRPLSAALPLLLEGKREEIARTFYDGCGYYRHGGPWPKNAKPEDSGAIRDSFQFADRIIAMLGGGE